MIDPSLSMHRRHFLFAALAVGMLPLTGILVDPADARGTRAASASLGPLRNIPQTWNNCGPASIAEVLAYWGISRTQEEVRSVLRVDGPSAGMTPYGVPSYARGLGLQALVGVGGTESLVKDLVAAGFPVLVHQVVSLADLVGHWRPVEAYDDRQGIFVASDPYLGPDHAITYTDFAQMWAYRGNAFIVLYPRSRQAALSAALAGAGWHRAAAYAHDLALLRAYQLDVSPAGTPQSAAAGFHYLGLAWDAAQLGQRGAARAYLQSAMRAGANPIQANWVGAAIG